MLRGKGDGTRCRYDDQIWAANGAGCCADSQLKGDSVVLLAPHTIACNYG